MTNQAISSAVEKYNAAQAAWRKARTVTFGLGLDLQDARKFLLRAATQAKNNKIIGKRELEIFRVHFRSGQTLEMTGKHFDVTRERIRIIIEAVLIRMACAE
mgnify:FL=1